MRSTTNLSESRNRLAIRLMIAALAALLAVLATACSPEVTGPVSVNVVPPPPPPPPPPLPIPDPPPVPEPPGKGPGDDGVDPREPIE